MALSIINTLNPSWQEKSGFGNPMKGLRAWETYNFSARTPSAYLAKWVSDKNLNGEHCITPQPADLFSETYNKSNLPHK